MYFRGYMIRGSNFVVQLFLGNSFRGCVIRVSAGCGKVTDFFYSFMKFIQMEPSIWEQLVYLHKMYTILHFRSRFKGLFTKIIRTKNDSCFVLIFCSWGRYVLYIYNIYSILTSKFILYHGLENLMGLSTIKNKLSDAFFFKYFRIFIWRCWIRLKN